MHRFFLPAESFSTPEIRLPEEPAQQIRRVLRLKEGSPIVLLDNLGNEYPATICEITDQAVIALVKEKKRAQGEPRTRVNLILGLTQREKFEWVLQKCTEIGVATILPVITSRTLVQKMGDVEDKYPRWKKILQEAAEQSHRGKIPDLLPAMKFESALDQFESSLKLVLWEEEENFTLKEKIRNYKGGQVTLLVGPEGGLSAEEVECARRHGFSAVSLGRRILRTETASMLACGLVLYELE